MDKVDIMRTAIMEEIDKRVISLKATISKLNEEQLVSLMRLLKMEPDEIAIENYSDAINWDYKETSFEQKRTYYIN